MKTDAEILTELIEEMKLADQEPDPSWTKEQIEAWITAKLNVDVRRKIWLRVWNGT